jgi:RimJ/RimL family protein N-acetyltransferase
VHTAAHEEDVRTGDGPKTGARGHGAAGAAGTSTVDAGTSTAEAGQRSSAGDRAAEAERAAAETVDLRLPDGLVALLDDQEPTGTAGARIPAPAGAPAAAPYRPAASGFRDETGAARAPDASHAFADPHGASATTGPGASQEPAGPRVPEGPAAPRGGAHMAARSRAHAGFDPTLLDGLADWGPVSSRVGVFHLVPVRPDRDLALISRWMNDPAVAAFWELEGPERITADHLRPQLEGDGRSMPCLGVLDGLPISYFEIYRADLDPLARHCPVHPHDTGVHLLVGGVADRGRGVGSALLRAVSDHILDHRPRCTRVLAEPDLRNTPSVSAFLSGGFRFAAEIDLPDKRAALMVRDRAFRGHL